ncbi:MAG: cupin domain-containing protein [Spirochaetales bacterium]|nr:cupin domain-containing protein [Spirochaetales bacterium]
MIIKRSEMMTETKEQMRGGDGVITITHLEKPADMINGRLLADITIPPQASIGEHEHVGETEYYIITAGKGVVVDNGVAMDVAAGEVVKTPDGSTHSIRNTGDSDLKMIAVIVTYGK